MQKLTFFVSVAIITFTSLASKAQQINNDNQNIIKLGDKTITTSKVDNMPIISPTEKMEMPCLTIYFNSNMPILSEEKKKKLEDGLRELCNRMNEYQINQPDFFKNLKPENKNIFAEKFECYGNNTIKPAFQKNLKPKKRTGFDMKLMVE